MHKKRALKENEPIKMKAYVKHCSWITPRRNLVVFFCNHLTNYTVYGKIT